ncbi:hypothetical protein LIER_28387 [Lithospermum erythrorhizon]|uniref:DUF4219 domain-containing protein n=1 Tax=Lithospermum erythrorhizon TaxID=34254 RepID=A0AAV3RLI3_LITER
MMIDFSTSIEKLNNNNYVSWSTRMKFYLLGHELWDIVNGNDTTPPREVRSTTTTSDTSTSTPSTLVRPVVVDQRIDGDPDTVKKWKAKAGKDLVEEYTLSTICEYSGDLKNDGIIDPGLSNYIIGDEVKVYKDLKIIGTPIMEGQKMETVNVMLAGEVCEDKNVFPDTQELQEKLQIKLQLGPSEDVIDQT